MTANDEPETGPETTLARQCLLRLGLALLVTLAQILAGVAMAVAWWLPAVIATAAGADSWLGLVYAILGALAAVATASVIGAFTAAKLRLPLYVLYALPVLLPAASQWIQFNSSLLPWERYGLLTVIGGNVLIALVTAGRPRRRAKTKGRRAPIQSAPSS